MSNVAVKQNNQNDWQFLPIKDFAHTTSGGTPKRGVAKYYNGDVPWVKSGDLNDGYLNSVDEFITELGLKESSAKLFKPGTVLIALYGATIGRLSILNFEAATNQAVCGINVPENVNVKYLFYYLLSIRQKLIDQGKGGAQPNINQQIVKETVVPLAPPEQQKRIVAKIEELFSHIDAGIEALKKAKQLLKQYRQSVLKAAVTGELTKEWREANKGSIGAVKELLESIEKPPRPNRWKTKSREVIVGHRALAVGNPGTSLPEGWEWVALVDIAKMESGHTPSRRHPEWWDGDIAWIGIVDARKHHCGTIFETIQHTNEDGLANSASRLLPKGTVCVSRTASVGYVITLGRDMATSQDFVNWVPTPAITSAWLQLIFIADTDGLRRFGKGTVHKTIYFPEWLSVHVGLPSIKEQLVLSEIVGEKFIAIERLDSEIDVQIIKAENNKQSILAAAFSGSLSNEKNYRVKL